MSEVFTMTYPVAITLNAQVIVDRIVDALDSENMTDVKALEAADALEKAAKDIRAEVLERNLK